MTDNATPYNAAEFDEGVRKTIPLYEHFYLETIDLLQSRQPDIHLWLDTGCGTGALIAKAYSLYNQTKFVLADPSAEMLGKAQERLRNIPREKIEFLEPRGTEDISPELQGQFDVITAIQSHHYLSQEKREVATRNCWSMLQEGGMYIYFENIYPDTEVGKEIGLKRWKTFQQRQGKSEQEAAQHIKRFNASYFPITREAHLSMLRRTGFTVAEVFWLSCMQAGFYAIK